MLLTFSDLFERNPHAGVHRRVVLGDRLDVVVPALFLPSEPSELELLQSISLSGVSAVSHSAYLTSKATVGCLRQFHGIDLGSQEGNLGALPHSAL